ncbi:4-hydroxyproline epimerase [Tenacibaculum finnmarkense genomovar finnmarkense]|uniref:4-hydroxyproline epimerase n=3 Tax=Tenacibaculum TaxID=104267 RepID=A0AAP1RG35_9FLAO|nr:4-hydroxyproline epimerase [Tenacibaculum finnmarkense]MBE7653196.1 4-hydroxyproline epimerase [Tenacibaculum finnmarkense genomovar finnmarkense]MBE7660000.1 4-hydroxyproline epimerase [Tenacibaculum finnmarkense genomovar finnmarkense]MBE7693004.1 4-hydroxyproline epimerase [Tenacibaculum finnmarkense genomovar finnmarkense]MBE7695434.1 4-hydroxyproline epimerase [Tenacibaculum finnmarkense genomovar finnmarkense]MCD8403033.1 4-hydroxyproline epimerase [Tenacibaculum finnmarkense genomova
MRKTFFCVDAHTCGNPVRVVAGGGPNLIGANMSEKRQHFLKEYDWIRKGLMFEPRGHDMMSGSILFPPHSPENDFGILFIETSGCLPMCGHGTIGTITIAIEEGLIIPKIPGKIKMEAPAGLVNIEYGQTGKKVDWVRLTNVKSYLAAENLTIDCPELGEITFDVSYGGNYYAIVDPQKNFSGVHDFTASKIIQYSQVVRDRINEKYPDMFIHPENDTIRDVTHMLWTGNPIDPTSSGRNAVFYGDKAIDRSPCGTGTSARLAQLHAKGKLQLKEEFIHESFIGSKFIGRVEEETTLNGKPAIIPSIQGWAKVFGYNNIIIDDQDDPYAHGFQVI